MDSVVTIAWQAPPDCPTEGTVRRLYNDLAGEVADTAHVEAHASVVSRADGAFVLRLELASLSGKNRLELTAARCETLAEVVALQMAVAADASRALSNVSPAPAGVLLGAQAAFGLVHGPLPGTAMAARLLGRVSLDRIEFQAGAGYLLPRGARYGGALGDLGAEMDLAFVVTRICSRGPLVELALALCGGANLGSLRATGEGLDPVYTTRQFWGAVTVAPTIDWQLTPHVAVHLEMEGGVALSRPGVRARNLETLFTPERGTISVWAGVTSTF